MPGEGSRLTTVPFTVTRSELALCACNVPDDVANAIKIRSASRLGSFTRPLYPLSTVVAAGIVRTVNGARFAIDCASRCDEEHGFESERFVR